MVGNSSLLALLLGVVASLFSAGTRGDAGQELLQPQGSVSVPRGENLTLECRVSFLSTPPGPVKWFLGKGRTRKLIYSDTRPSARVTRAEPGSNTDFTISIRIVVPEDAGTYYCVKQRTPGDQDWLSGPGTEVAVRSSQDDDNLPRVTAIPVAAGTVCSLLLAVLFSAALYFYIKKKRGKKPCPSRPEGPLPENPRAPHQAPADKEIVYVDVKLASASAQRPKQSKLEEQSTYATIR